MARSHRNPVKRDGVFMSEAPEPAEERLHITAAANKCNDGVLSNKISSTLSNPPATSSAVREAALAFLWRGYGIQMSS